MKTAKAISGAAAAAMVLGVAALSTTAARAATIKEVCEKSLTAEGASDISGCACLQEKSAGNPDLEAELIALDDKGPGIEPRRAAAQSDAAKAALDACFPKQ